jgi:glyoxylase-like metal-dependent hydrolase (beta-lactamase superfamily II)
VADGVHRIPLPLPGDGLRAVNVYAVEDGNRIALVDAGWHRPEAWQALRDGLRRIGAKVGDVTRVLVTHLHHDHFGQAPRLRRTSGAVIALGEGERRSLEVVMDAEQAERADGFRIDLLTRHGAGELAAAAHHAGQGFGWRGNGMWEMPDDFVGDRTRIDLTTRSLTVVSTPGHTRGHVSFLDERAGVLFAGDHVLPHITPSVGFESYNEGMSLVDFLGSLSRVRRLDVRQVLPAHGPDFPDLAARVDELLEHHDHRLRACVELVGTTERTAFDVAQRLPWTRRQRKYDELDLLNRVLAVLEALAHLEYLAIDGVLSRTATDGMVVFSRASENGCTGER